MIVEYYDIRTGKTEDYGLNINDNTPLLILALWHHYNATGDEDFLREVYPAAAKAARYILSQRNDQGLVWCTATGTSDWGIIGWRNVIKDYRLSGATTEVNSECCRCPANRGADGPSAGAARGERGVLRRGGRAQDGDQYASVQPGQRAVLSEHRYGGTPRSDVTADLVFPVMFGVATDETAARISQPSERVLTSGPRAVSARCRATRRTTVPAPNPPMA